MRTHPRLPNTNARDHAVPGAPPSPPAGELERERESLCRIETLFHEALECAPATRLAWLRARYPDQPDLVREVLALLSADADALQPDGPLSQPAGFLADLIPDAETGTDRTGATWDGDADGGPARAPLGRLAPGDPVGVYRILRVLGEGGMGTVYLAEREDVGATVALKVVRATLAHSTRARARFLAERRALARLAHPNIARLLDAGVVEGGPAHGAPWFAMEYVDGLPLDVACDARRRDVRARLALFAEVCGAVEAAHRQHVVHRDLKPSNVLVTDDGRPVLLDFGVAAVLGGAEATRAGATRAGAALATVAVAASEPLTPQYAAPEQVREEPPSVACDVYALGLVLYELLTGRRPYEVRGRTRGDAVRAVLSARVLPPSQVATVGTDAVARAAARATHPGALRRALRGDLDAIVLRALAPDPAARYATASALYDDVRRVLAHQPVTARPLRGLPRLVYRAARLTRRHRAGAAAALVLVACVGAGAGAYVREMRAAREARVAHEQAQVAATRAAQLRALLVDLLETTPFPGVLGAESAAVPNGPGSPATRLLVHSERAADALAARPEAQAELLVAVGRAWGRGGDSTAAARVLRRAAEIRRRLDRGEAVVVGPVDAIAPAVAARRLAAAESAVVEAAALRNARDGGAIVAGPRP